MQCRNNNDNHNNDYRVNQLHFIKPALQHREFVETKILPPFQKTKNSSYYFIKTQVLFTNVC